MHGFRTSLDEIAALAPAFNPRKAQTFKIHQSNVEMSSNVVNENEEKATPDDIQTDATEQDKTTKSDVKGQVKGDGADSVAANSWIMARALDTTLKSFEVA